MFGCASARKDTLVEPVKDINRREYFLLIALLIPTVILGLFPNVLLEALHLSVSSLLYIV
jgi:NADH-ubiquinone oxidoreductase chain 4